MCSKYLIGDMLSALDGKRCFYNLPVSVDYSGVCEGILSVMQNYGYVESFSVSGEKNKSIDVILRLFNGKKTLNSFKLYSKPSRRLYRTKEELRKMIKYSEYSLLIVSTSKGVMSAGEAVKLGIGGEVLCEIF